MPITVLAGGTPETSNRIRKLSDELVYAMERYFNFEKAPLLKPDLIVLNVIAIAPHRGSIPDGTSFKRSQHEFWTTFNVNYAAFESSDPRLRLEALAASFQGAFAQVPVSRTPAEIKAQFNNALRKAVTLLVSEPERL